MNTNTQFLPILKMMSLLLILNAESLWAAVEWPWQQAAEQKSKNSNVSASPSTSPVMAQPQDRSLNTVQPIKPNATAFKGATSKTSELAASQTGAGLTQPFVVPEAKVKEPAVSSQNIFTITALQRNTHYEEAVKLQAKLNGLLRVSSEIDRLNRSKVVAVQSMVDKARLNQKILTLLASPGDATAKIRQGDAAQILLSKKIRGMREEAEKQIALAQSHKDSVLPAVQKKV